MNKSRDTAPRQLFKRKDVSASGWQKVAKLELNYGAPFLRYKLPVLSKIMKEGERGIIYGVRRYDPKTRQARGHVFNVVKRKGELLFLDAQSASRASFGFREYKEFRYLHTNK